MTITVTFQKFIEVVGGIFIAWAIFMLAVGVWMLLTFDHSPIDDFRWWRKKRRERRERGRDR
jgi:hypothetical protein